MIREIRFTPPAHRTSSSTPCSSLHLHASRRSPRGFHPEFSLSHNFAMVKSWFEQGTLPKTNLLINYLSHQTSTSSSPAWSPPLPSPFGSLHKSNLQTHVAGDKANAVTPGTSFRFHHAYCLILTRDNLYLALMQYGVVGFRTTSKSGLLNISEM